METIDTYLSHALTRWNLVRASIFAFLALTFSITAVSFPAGLTLIAVIWLGPGIAFGFAALMKGDWLWGRAAIIVAGLMLFMSVLMRAASGSILQSLPILLLAYVMTMFGAEALALACEHHGIHSTDTHAQWFPYSVPMQRKSLEHLIKRISILGAILAVCFVLTTVVVFLGDVFAAALPAVSSISVYIVVVSISFALLLALRED